MTHDSGVELTGRTLHAGRADGELVVLAEPLSFWGGVDASGRLIDASHPQRGVELAGRVLVMSAAKGSSSSTSVLAEQIRAGVAPAAVVLARPDPIIVVGALVAAELYGAVVPVVVLAPAQLAGLAGCTRASVEAGETRAVVRATTVTGR